jgi:hypothetical protein
VTPSVHAPPRSTPSAPPNGTAAAEAGESEGGSSIHDKLLSEELLSGGKSLATPNLLAQLKAQSLQKLATDQPKYSALAVALQKWTH